MRKDPTMYMTQYLMNLEVFPSCWWEQALFLAMCECQTLFSLILLDGSFPGLRQFFHMCELTRTWLNNGKQSSGDFWNSFSLVLSPSYLVLPRFSVSSPNAEKSAGLHLVPVSYLPTLHEGLKLSQRQ